MVPFGDNMTLEMMAPLWLQKGAQRQQYNTEAVLTVTLLAFLSGL
jgi:hypothetical protein